MRDSISNTNTFQQFNNTNTTFEKNKAGYTATPVACGWAGAIIEVTPSFGQEQ